MTSHQIVALLLDLALIVVLARVLGMLATRIGQPAVIGEVLAGILVGPTLWHGAISDTLFPVAERPSLSALADVGVVLFMFVNGLEMDRRLIKGQGRTAVLVSTLSTALPFVLGILLASYLYRDHHTAHRLAFVLFFGAAMSVTAFPVLARILSDRGMRSTRIGTLALASAAIGDVLAWCLLAVVVAISGVGGGGELLTLGLIPYAALMIGAVRPLLRRLIAANGPGELKSGVLATVLAGLLVSAGLTEWMGLHFIFGAFLFGLVMPREGADLLREELIHGFGQVSSVLLLPVYFIVAGFNVNLSHLSPSELLELALILTAAIGGKFLGAFTAARGGGMPVRDSAVLGTLMNTRGLTELIILGVGLQFGVLDKDLYSLMVVMAVTTTAMAGPLLSLVHPEPWPVEERLLATV